MRDKIARYRRGTTPLPATNLSWPLYGPGLTALGCLGEPVSVGLPTCGSDELLVRHDAVGLCYSDLKEISLGAEHPRLRGRHLASDPVIPGHEAAVTVVAVGSNLAGQYHCGDRFTVQPDVWYRGQSIPYGYSLPGAYQQFNVIGEAILKGDVGNYLVRIPGALTFAGAALTEPWACVEASYRMSYRTRLRGGGVTWFVGSPKSRSGYHLSAIWDANDPPARVILSQVPKDLAGLVRALAASAGAALQEHSMEEILMEGQPCDDIVVLDGDPAAINAASGQLANDGVLALVSEVKLERPIELDLGRLHYDHIFYCGSTGLELDVAYQGTLPRTELVPGGTALILGAGGPMGRMHLQRALEGVGHPRRIIATDVSGARLADLACSFADLAGRHEVDFSALNPVEDAAAGRYTLEVAHRQGGIDDVEVMAARPEAVLPVLPYLAPGAVVNFFAGLKRGTKITVDARLIYGAQQVRFVGHSGSGLADQVAIVERAASGQLAPERSVVAVGGLRQIPEGIRAMANAAFPGKIVIFPMVPDFALTALPDLRGVLPRVHDRLTDGRFWTAAAESEFLSALLPN